MSPNPTPLFTTTGGNPCLTTVALWKKTPVRRGRSLLFYIFVSFEACICFRRGSRRGLPPEHRLKYEDILNTAR